MQYVHENPERFDGVGKRTRARGFTLIELMVVVAILSIITMIAIPAYMDYTIRTKVSEGLAMFGPIKQNIADAYYTNGGMWPSNNAEAGMVLASSYQTKYLESIAISGSSAVITFNIPDLGPLNTIVFTPTSSLGGVDWACTKGSMLSKYRPPVCR